MASAKAFMPSQDIHGSMTFAGGQELSALLDSSKLSNTSSVYNCVYMLGFTQTTASFKKQQQLPRHISIPDILIMQGQVARYYAETCLQKFISDNLLRLTELTEKDLIKEFTQHKLTLRQGFVSTGMGDLQSKLLTVDEAKKRKADAVVHKRKQRKLLEAEQPKTIECAA